MLASATDHLHTIVDKGRCLPGKIGLTKGYSGNATTKISVPRHEWVLVGKLKKTENTLNHHCSQHCDGEPTRSNYKISATVDDFAPSFDGDRELRNPAIHCVAGPCGGWLHVYGVTVSETGKSMEGSFDVWSKPTTWELTADVYERQIVDTDEQVSNNKVSEEELFKVSLPTEARPRLFPEQ